MLPTEPLEVREKSISDLLIEMSRTCSCRNEKDSYILIRYIDVLTTGANIFHDIHEAL